MTHSLFYDSISAHLTHVTAIECICVPLLHDMTRLGRNEKQKCYVEIQEAQTWI